MIQQNIFDGSDLNIARIIFCLCELIPGHCYSNCNPFEDSFFALIAHAFALVWCVRRRASNRVQTIDELMKWLKLNQIEPEWFFFGIELKCVGQEVKQARVSNSSVRLKTDTASEHVVHILFRCFTVVRRLDARTHAPFCPSSAVVSAKLNLEHLSRCIDRQWRYIASCHTLILVNMCIAQGVTHVLLQRVHAQMFDYW